MTKYEKLKRTILSICRRLRAERAAVAFSGGADSALLLKAAADALGRGRVTAVIGDSPTYPPSEKTAAEALARKLGVGLIVVGTRELGNPAFSANPPDRCFHCKTELFSKIIKAVSPRGKSAVFYGATVSDDDDFRPGEKAAAAAGAFAPLREAGLAKKDVRAVSRALGLPTAEKPSQACLASRFPYGEKITPGKLRSVANAEAALRRLGFRELRVRYHSAGPRGGTLARVETGKNEFAAALRKAKKISAALKKAGFTYAALDLDGFRSGSQNLIFRRSP